MRITWKANVSWELKVYKHWRSITNVATLKSAVKVTHHSLFTAHGFTREFYFGVSRVSFTREFHAWEVRWLVINRDAKVFSHMVFSQRLKKKKSFSHLVKLQRSTKYNCFLWFVVWVFLLPSGRKICYLRMIKATSHSLSLLSSFFPCSRSTILQQLSQ